MPLFDYACRLGHTTEAIRSSVVVGIACPTCGLMARRPPAHRIAITSPEVDTRNMFRRFTEASAEIDHAATRHEQETERPIQGLNLWQKAKQRAADMLAAGENPYTRPHE